MPAAKRTRRNAWRSCAACRTRKQRCELPESVVLRDPSKVPLQGDEACVRCHVMDIPCLLDDYEKRGRIAVEKRRRSRVGSAASSQPLPPPPSPRPTSSAVPSDPSPASVTTTALTPAATASPAHYTHPTNLEDYKRYTPRSRPLTLVSELAVRQPSFGALTEHFAGLVPPTANSTDSLDQLVDAQLAHHLSVWCEAHLPVWLPSVPSPADVRSARLRGQPVSASMRLLEVLQYLLAIQHASSSSAQALRRTATAVHLARMVEFYLARCLLHAQHDLTAAHAIELLSVFPIASAYIDRPDGSKVDTLEVSVLASAARRIATTCRQAYAANKATLLSTRGDNDDVREARNDEHLSIRTQREMDVGLAWCSTTAWELVQCTGSDDVVFFFVPHHMPTVEDVQRLLQYARTHPVPGQVGLGQLFVLMHSHMIAHIATSLNAMRDEKPAVLQGPKDRNVSNGQRLNDLKRLLDDHEDRMQASKDLRCSLLDRHPLPEAQILLHWLDMEEQSWFLLLAGIAIFYAIQAPNSDAVRRFTPQFLTAMIRGDEGVDKDMRSFVFKHGDDRLDVGESLLTIAAQMGAIPSTPAERDFVVPPLATAGIVMEACMLSMEVHGTTAKEWRTMPRRARPWQQGMRGAMAMLRRMNDVSEEEGGVLPTSARIITGMLEVIATWERALSRARLSASSTQSTSTTAAKATATVTPATPDTRVAGVDIGIPPLATDGEQISLDQLLRDMFGSTDWVDVLPSVAQSRPATV